MKRSLPLPNTPSGFSGAPQTCSLAASGQTMITAFSSTASRARLQRASRMAAGRTLQDRAELRREGGYDSRSGGREQRGRDRGGNGVGPEPGLSCPAPPASMLPRDQVKGCLSGWMRLLLPSLGDLDGLGLSQRHQCNFLSTSHQGWTEINQPTNQSKALPHPRLPGQALTSSGPASAQKARSPSGSLGLEGQPRPVTVHQQPPS